MKDREQRNSYYRVYMQRLRKERRTMVVSLLGGKCAICGSVDDLEIDHTDRAQKSANVDAALSWSLERLLLEMQKCQLLCRTHHQEKSAVECSVRHGGGASGKKNCKCVLCRKRKASYMAARKTAKRLYAGSIPAP